MVFVVHACGFTPRCALEDDNAAETRVEKILRIISECDLSIHDISRTRLDDTTQLPRFNMPFELGLFLGAARLGGQRHQDKAALILDVEKFRYQKFLSDIAGQDIRSHAGDPEQLMDCVRKWLNSKVSAERILPGKRALVSLYSAFQKNLPAMLSNLGVRPEEIDFITWTRLIRRWLLEVSSV
jgi:hypothetical protein